jgi:hypothetical protein
MNNHRKRTTPLVENTWQHVAPPTRGQWDVVPLLTENHPQPRSGDALLLGLLGMHVIASAPASAQPLEPTILEPEHDQRAQSMDGVVDARVGTQGRPLQVGQVALELGQQTRALPLGELDLVALTHAPQQLSLALRLAAGRASVGVGCGRHATPRDYTASSTAAAPSPPAAQMPNSAWALPLRCSSLAMVMTMRAPVAPNG